MAIFTARLTIEEARQALHDAADLVEKAMASLDTHYTPCQTCQSRHYRKPVQSKAHLDLRETPERLRRVASVLRAEQTTQKEDMTDVKAHNVPGVRAARGRAAGGYPDRRPGGNRGVDR